MSRMSETELRPLIEAVRTNCHIADARHARDMTMCNYLLGMRELYRWERGLPLAHPLSRQEIGDWLTRREAHWEGLEHRNFIDIPVCGTRFEPFDIAGINTALIELGLVYGAGLGRFGAPHFFLGDLLRSERREGLHILVSGAELARDLHAAPAAFRDGAVFLRQDALRRWLWEKMEIWGVRRADGALKSAFDCYGFEEDSESALERMAERESETLILHEIGESLAEPILGPAWQDMLGSFSGRRAELLARAVRDHLADCLWTLPKLIEREAWCSLHFYFANFEGVRSLLFPRLERAYQAWRETDRSEALDDAVADGRRHWTDVALRLLALHREEAERAEAIFDGWVTDPRELTL